MSRRTLNFALLLLAMASGAGLIQVAPLTAAPVPGGVFVPTPVDPGAVATGLLDSFLYDYDVVELPVSAIERRVDATGRLGLVLRGRLYELELVPVDLFTEDYRAVLLTDVGPVDVPRPNPKTYQGSVTGPSDSRVALTVTPRFFTLSIRDDEHELFLDPLGDFVRGAPRRLAVVYTAADVRPESSGTCGAQAGHSPSSRLGSLGIHGSLIERAHTTLRQLDLATDADGEYFSLYGSPGTFNRIAAIVNDADVAYRRDLNLDLDISFQQAWSNASTDPYGSTSIYTTLSDLASWWNTNRSGTNRDSTHLFSGKNFDGSFIGLAYLDAVCDQPSIAYGVNEDYGGSFVRATLFAHELGHNLSARHDDDIGCSGVTCSGSGPIMCSFIQSSGSFTFSSCSQSAIDTFTHNNGGCLN